MYWEWLLIFHKLVYLINKMIPPHHRCWTVNYFFKVSLCQSFWVGISLQTLPSSCSSWVSDPFWWGMCQNYKCTNLFMVLWGQIPRVKSNIQNPKIPLWLLEAVLCVKDTSLKSYNYFFLVFTYILQIKVLYAEHTMLG